MYTLYGMTGSCSMAVHVVLEELKVAYHVIDVRVAPGQPKPEAFLKVNPRGSVPVLAWDGHSMREGGAILSYLLDSHANQLLPKSGPARATALEWLMFANATLHPAYVRVFYFNGTIQDATQRDALVDGALEKINALWADVNQQLGDKPYICGNDISAADILLTVIANWLQPNYGGRIVLGEHTKQMIRRVIARPSYQKALADEKVEYKAAA